MLQKKKNGKIRKVAKLIMITIFIFTVGGLGGVTIDRYVLPKLSHCDFLAGLDLVKKINEKVVVINKTERVVVEEYDSISETASQAAVAVVDIVSIPNEAKTERSDFNYDARVKNGTGIIIACDGLIVTYRSAIIEEKAEHKIWTFDGSSYDAKFLGVDEFTDLAYLKIDASNLPVISFANSDNFKPGKKLIAIGNSLGEYQNNFSAGLLGGINKTFNLSGKTVSSSEKLEGVFEMNLDNQKYVGGPIISYGGELVGVTGLVEVNNENKYFQISSNVVKESSDLAIAGDLKKRAFLGVYYLSITKSYAMAVGLDRDRGALIYSPSGKQGLAILAKSPAEKAELKINDIIIAIDEKEINLDNSLSRLISHYRKGDQAKFLVIRNGEEMEIEVKF